MRAVKLCTNKMLRLMHVDLYNGCKMVVGVVVVTGICNLLYRHVSFMRHFKKIADRINTKYAAEI